MKETYAPAVLRELTRAARDGTSAAAPRPPVPIQPIAFALAVGVAVDAFAVLVTLVPAVLALAGRGAWWLPGRLDRLDRILPDLDVERSGLRKAVPAERGYPSPRLRVGRVGTPGGDGPLPKCRALARS